MKRWLSGSLVAVLSLAAGVGSVAGQAASTTVSLKIQGFQGTDGQALVALYDSADSWLNVPKAAQLVRAKITGAELSLDLKGVKPGSYAVSVIHDANANDKLDMRWLPYPKPKEGSGTSNDAEPKAGPPKWEAAKFDITGAPAVLTITLKYP